MGISVCPIALVDAPPETVWASLMELETWAAGGGWQRRPPGPLQPGQSVLAREALVFRVSFHIEGVDAGNRQLRFRSHLPLGVRGRHLISVEPSAGGQSRVSYG